MRRGIASGQTATARTSPLKEKKECGKGTGVGWVGSASRKERLPWGGSSPDSIKCCENNKKRENKPRTPQHQ